MTKKMLRNQIDTSLNNNNGIVGVIGSIPFASTTFTVPDHVHIIELPGNWQLVPAIEWEKTGGSIRQVLCKIQSKRFENGLNGKRRRKSA